MKWLTNLDLNNNELQNFRIQSLATAPVNPTAGKIYFNSADKIFYGYNGTSWIDLGQTLNGTAIVSLINACSSTIDDNNLSSNVADALSKRHSHNNAAVLNAMETAFTNALKTKLDGISIAANKVESSTTNGNIKIDGVEKIVYTHPGTGTNPHGTTKSDIGLSNVENKSSLVIRSEITSSNVTAALGYTPIKNGGNTPEIRGGIASSRPTSTGSGLIYFETDTGKIYKDTASGVWTKMGGQDIPIASPTILGLIKVGANLTITEDGTLSANDNPSSFIVKQERFTVNSGVTAFTLAKGTYKPNTSSLFWYLDGVKQDNKALTESSSTTFGIPAGLPEGCEILIEYIELINAHPFPYHANEHLSSGVDPIPEATATQNGLMSSSDKNKLNGITVGAQPNQNAFSNIKIGASIIASDSEADTVEFVAGTNITLTPDTANDKITIGLGSAVETTSGAQAKATTAENNAKAYADSKVASLINTAPGTLDTLNELATALGNDPNFATTITNLINTRTRKFTATIGDGVVTVFNVVHNFNTLDTNASLREVASGEWVMSDIQTIDTNTIKLLFATPPSAGQYKLTITG